MMLWLNVLGSAMLVTGLPTALLDMGMNGARYAYWAPWGLGVSLVGVLLASL
jgi:hypothetical protein